jgi:hypothetical protein
MMNCVEVLPAPMEKITLEWYYYHYLFKKKNKGNNIWLRNHHMYVHTASLSNVFEIGLIYLMIYVDRSGHWRQAGPGAAVCGL